MPKIPPSNNPRSHIFKKVFTVSGTVSILNDRDEVLFSHLVTRKEVPVLLEYLCRIFQGIQHGCLAYHGSRQSYIMEIVNGRNDNPADALKFIMTDGDVGRFMTDPVERAWLIDACKATLGGHETQLATQGDVTEDTTLYEDVYDVIC